MQKCFGAYERHLSDYDELKASVLNTATILKFVPESSNTPTSPGTVRRLDDDSTT